ncbi:RNA methyltransferase, TrmH family, group 1 [Ferrimonas balearica DSM 9799]|uniref:tRNA (cytidine/uridine-2'-O-)-methyltransferase TrmJ n=1 Tax=Ferrimonas balearica (strain DSM 9799 / CCM 4581 / KCTC 23876 / PAT) TaxID=550540 RepID=E1SSD6_FERBD|nr:tRNA/rRNA methyltransferase [Ferrimonas balearica]ADN74976.1 RNA methyltransferase, TrmH family, group 1 [Ferrimonas balearica DSM 9799]
MAELIFILVSPARGENVGAAARAMKTMGFSRLRVVGSDAHKSEQASWVAHGSGTILEEAESFATLAEALADVDLSLATTARRRGDKRRLHTPAEAAQQVRALGNSVNTVAVVFGCEESGLSNEDLALVDLLTTIPLVNPYPSLNLGQAIMLYAYEFSQAELEREACADAGQFVALKQRSQALLDKLGVAEDEPLRRWAGDSLGTLSQRDVAMLHLLIGDIEKAITK